MNKLAFGLIAGVLSLSAVASAAKSGLAVGEGVAPFHPQHVVGPLANTTNCFPCTFQNAPQVQVWINGDDMANVAAIAKDLEAKIDANKAKGFKAMIVMVSPKAKWGGLKDQIKTLAARNGLKSLAISMIDPSNSALKDYKISAAGGVKNTVMVYRNWKVQKNFVNLKADKAGLKSLNAGIAGILA